MVYKSTRELPRKARKIHRIFTKPELLRIAKELSLDLEGINTRQIVLGIVNDLEETGMPISDECSDELFEFMLNIDLIDEDGMEIPETSEPDQNMVEELLVVHEEVERPECFSFAEIRDPACKRCVLFDPCSVARRKARPKCFGLRYSEETEECRGCIEANACRVNMR